MTHYNTSFQSEPQDFFIGLTKICPCRPYSVVFAILGSYFTLFMSSCIIWHQKRGTDLKRTIISRILTVCWYLCMSWFLFPLHVDILRYLFGPLPKFICHANAFFQFFVTIQIIFLLDVIVISRYVFIFILKNPAAFHDEFWTCFIFLISFTFASVSQIVLYWLPGKDFPSIWICSGTDPTSSTCMPYKGTLGNLIFKILSGILHMAVAVKIKLYKLKIEKIKEKYHPRSKMFWLLSTETDSAVDIIESVTAAILLGLAVSLHNPRKEIALELLNQYPDCLGEHFYTLIRPPLTGILIVLSKLISDKRLRIFLSNEWKLFQERRNPAIIC